MPLELRVDGETVATIDEQVTRIGLQTARGEVSAMGVGPGDGVIDIVVDRVAEGGPRRLDQIEAADLENIRERTPEGTKVGFTAADQVNPVLAGQGFHDESLRPGGVDKDKSSRSVTRPPTRDLAAGLDPGDHEALTKRIEAFTKDGDVDKAIKDNPRTDKPFTAEEGATEPPLPEPESSDGGKVPGKGADDQGSNASPSTTGGTEPATGGAPVPGGGSGGLDLGVNLPGGTKSGAQASGSASKASGTTKKS